MSSTLARTTAQKKTCELLIVHIGLRMLLLRGHFLLFLRCFTQNYLMRLLKGDIFIHTPC